MIAWFAFVLALFDFLVITVSVWGLRRLWKKAEPLIAPYLAMFAPEHPAADLYPETPLPPLPGSLGQSSVILDVNSRERIE